MTAALTFAGLLVAGASMWTFGEYVMHRFVMHEAKGRGLPSREHLRHHAEYDSVLESWWFAWAGIVGLGVALGINMAKVVGPAGWGLGIGWVGAYGFYDWIHYRAHRRPIRHPYERWVRKHHFHHHFGHPTVNHGVTTPIWDKVFGTFEKVDRPIRVPRRLAMRWLVDGDGELRPQHADDYVLVGRRIDAGSDPQQDAIDRARAFANLAPTP
jgi:sterol desaturase/sphingolipid hydroxylase (fatty acid hydroxylase superfamily)